MSLCSLTKDEGRRTKAFCFIEAANRYRRPAFVLGLSSSVDLCSALSWYHFSWIHERHHAPQRRAHRFELALGVGSAHAVEVGPAVVVLVDPLLGEGAALDVRQQLLHGR